MTHALRRWRYRPGFALAAAITLALGIGSATAIFSIVDAVLLRPLPWTEPDRLVAIHAVFPERRQSPAAALTWNRGYVSFQAWDALRAERAFADVGAWRKPATLDTTFGEARTALVQTLDVSSNFLPMLGVKLVHGRFFNDTEDSTFTGSIVITYETWQRRFGGRSDIIGQSVRMGSASSGDDMLKMVVGVIERGFVFDGDPIPEVLLPIGIGARANRQSASPALRLVGRLAPSVSVASAAAAADRIIQALERTEPTTGRMVALIDDVVRGASRPLWLLFGGAALLLLIACSNVAGLLLGEARSRRHEIAVRAAIGGTRARIVRQLLVEHAALGVIGAVAGLGLAYGLMKLCVAVAPAALPRLDAVGLDARVIVFAFVLGVITLLVFGVAPALSLARTPAAQVLAEGGRDGASGRQLGQRAVVTAAIALALVLLVGASLLGETLFRLTARPLGFDPANLTVVSFRMTTLPNVPPPITAAEYAAQTPQQRQDRMQEAARLWTIGWRQHLAGAFDRLTALPGVTAVAGGYTAPFLGVRTTGMIRAAGRPPADAIATRRHAVTERYFETMKSPILRGRDFEPSDRLGVGATGMFRTGPPPPTVTVISRELERRWFGENAVGRQIVAGGGPGGGAEQMLTVIGVVSDARWRKTDDDDLAAYYVLAESFNSVNTVFIRTAEDATASSAVIRNTLLDYNPNIVVTSTIAMDDLVARSMVDERFRATLSLMFGGAALVLAAVGLYSLAGRRVADRRREIGVRVALGAGPGDVRSLVLLDGLRTIAIGLGAGLPAAYAASQITSTLLYGVTPTSPRVFLAAAAVLAIAAFAAMVLPARRAATIDPLRVLRE